MTKSQPSASPCAALASIGILLALSPICNAILIQPYNYMLDDSSMVSQPDSSGSLSPFYNDQSGSNEHGADKDVVSIIGDTLARLRYARMMDNQHQDEHQNGQLSAEVVDMIQNEQSQNQANGKQEAGEQSLSSSVANMLLNVAQAAANAGAAADEAQHEQGESGQSANGAAGSAHNNNNALSSRGSVLELDTTHSSAGSGSMPSKADLKVGPSQWFNPKETIPVLKISSMATPSKYKKVYFRSEKKLVDGAFHSASGEQDDKKSLMKPFNSGVQRRSSRGTSSSVPPSILQDGVIDFLKKFRDVYVQTRPVGSSSSSNLANVVVSAAASSPFAAVLAPSSGGSRPNLASALSAASSMVNSAALVAQAASSGPSTATSGSSAAASGSANSASSPGKSPLTAQSYVSFWSKTFPTWVRKMLKQMRRRSLYNSSKRQQQHQHQASSSLGQKIANGAVASVVEAASGSGGSSSSSSSSNSQSGSNSR